MCALHHGSAGPPFQTAGLPLRVRRSAVACITCRRRKIRCDVTISGTPCTNCRLDNDQCVTVNQKRPRKAKNAAVPSAQDSQALANRPLVTNTAPPPWSAIEYPVSVQENSSVHSAWPPLLSAETRWLPPNDVAYLTSQQALTLPKKAIIHTLLQYYFLHVHPCFPVVKESEFRDGSLHQTPFSLLVFRSMLFAAACHIPSQCVQDAGYASVAQLRYSLYKTAKSLYDFGVEKDPFHIAQATLLLAYHFDSTDPLCNATWLAIAVQHTRRTNALRENPQDHRRVSQSDIKRLWWCCVLRDRILALAPRRPLVITLDQFDPSKADYLTIDDVWEGESNFYSPPMRKVLYQVLISQCRLASILTPLVMSAEYSPDLVGPQVCINRERALGWQAYSRLSSWEKDYGALLGHEEANKNLAVAVNIHITSLFFIGALLAMLSRIAVLHLSDCRCTLSSPRLSDSAGREVYLRGIHSLVSKTNDEVQWFTSNHVLYFLPVSTRWLTLLQHALNILWLHGDDLDEQTVTSTSQPGTGTSTVLTSYTELDNDYSARFGLETLSQALPHLVRLTMSVYDSTSTVSSKEPQPQHQSRPPITQPNGSIDLTHLTPSEIIRLANISVRLSVAMDYASTIGDCRHFTFETLSSLLRRLDIHREPSDCSASSSTSSSGVAARAIPGAIPGERARPNMDIDPIGSGSGSESPPQMQYTIPGVVDAATPSSSSGSQHSRYALSPPPLLGLPLSLHGSGPGVDITGAAGTTCDGGDANADVDAVPGEDGGGGGGGATSLERFGATATTEMAGHSMQEWASELEEFLGPLFGL
ncbi:uncharacterized protein APUU_60311A [Aspergillus puulaauensis]|uniref:Zn(2)-C6 fungal-type domain-containing protein n=1 Tax=Aspergillus puulaauensis TaxID=1220207 RepID=A0A7R8ARW2_9EURO|nr:uncharacterized protein APUU_60311A [Aspergillus puulaauensis]BCS27263.1 hypothetical protein APUU_60311A [Aspergillus puulaauensis]